MTIGPWHFPQRVGWVGGTGGAAVCSVVDIGRSDVISDAISERSARCLVFDCDSMAARLASVVAMRVLFDSESALAVLASSVSVAARVRFDSESMASGG